MQLIPARGRKPTDMAFRMATDKDATYPREGTETSRRLCSAAQARRMQLIPARGRKLSYLSNRIPAFQDATYPREGTETIANVPFVNFLKMQLIPARGRKHCSSLLSSQYLKDATYPREGTETEYVSSHVCRSTGCNLSPRGDGNPLTSYTSKFHP